MDELKLNGQSKDIVSENIQKLKTLFPEVFIENKIDFEKLQAIVGNYIDNSNESYRFTWSGKNNAFRLSQTPSTGTLRPSLKYPDGTDDSKDFDTTQNLYIEGDNLEVLKLLQKSYNNRIKMIYIDPPYNKDKDFVYPDKWSDPIANYKKITGQTDEAGNITTSDAETEGGKHTKWLNMMYPRLRMARNLLCENGVLFVSIDDDEISNLRKLCNDVFGEENFVHCLKWKRKKQPSFLHGHVASVVEYILVYAKNKNELEKLSIEKRTDSNTRIDNAANAMSERIIKKGIRVKLPKEVNLIKAGIYQNKTMATEFLNDVAIENGRTLNEVTVRAQFRNDQSQIDRFCDEDVLFITVNYGLRRDLLEEELQKRKSIVDLLIDWGDNQDSDNEMKQIFGENKPFSYPKPTKLLYNLAKSLDSDEFIVLDFFSGSSTTAQAIMELNADDKGKRKFFLVQLPENLDEALENADQNEKQIIENAINLCEENKRPHLLTEIGKERIRRAGEKIKEELKKKYEEYINNPGENEQAPTNHEDIDIGFKVFKLDISNIKKWDVDVGEDFYKLSKKDQNAILIEKLGIEIDNFVEGRKDLDIVYEIMLKYGLDLTYPIEAYDVSGKKVYSIGMGAVIVCLEDEISEDLANDIVSLINKIEPNMVRVVIRDLSFVSDDAKTDFKNTLRDGVYSYFAKCSKKEDKENQFTFVTI